MSVVETDPSDKFVAARLGTWQTVDGENPDGSELRDRALEIVESGENIGVEVARQSLQYVWRRQTLPHGREWKQAERACERMLAQVQGEEVTR